VTPPAATPAARRAPATGRTRRASGAAAVATRVAPKIPRRVSGPARGRTAARPRPRPQAPPLGARLVAFATTLPDRSIVDRLVRGRAWIAVVGTLLIGLVAMQVSLLKLNAGIGSDVQRAAGLERTNGELRAQVSELESGDRIQENAAGLGMIMPPAGQITYLRAGGPAAAGATAQALHDQRFNDLSKAQALPGEGDPTASQPTGTSAGTGTSMGTGTNAGTGTSSGTGTGAGGSGTTDSTSSGTSSSGSGSTDSSSSSSTGSSGSSGTATTSTDPSSSGGSSTGQ
jgi:cell division protein FtsB